MECDSFMTYEEFTEKVSSVILTENGNCPVTPVIQMLQGKWKLQIIYELCMNWSSVSNIMKCLCG